MAHCHFYDNLCNLKHIERQMRMLDTRLHLLRDRLSCCRLHRLAHHHCCHPHHSDCHSHHSHCHSHHSHCHPHHSDCHSHHSHCHSHHSHCHPHHSHCHSHHSHCHPHHSHCHSHHSHCHLPCLGRRALLSRLDLERRLNRLRRLGMMLGSCRSHSHLALCDKPCDPCDVSTVVVKDGNVTVATEHDDGVTYAVESNSVTVEEPHKCCHHHCDI